MLPTFNPLISLRFIFGALYDVGANPNLVHMINVRCHEMAFERMAVFTHALPSLAFIVALVLAQVPMSVAGMDKHGNQITVTQEEAQYWTLFPVANKNDELIGQAAGVTLDTNGKIKLLRINISQHLGIGQKTVVVKPHQFTFNGARIMLDIPDEKIQDLPEAATAH